MALNQPRISLSAPPWRYGARVERCGRSAVIFLLLVLSAMLARADPSPFLKGVTVSCQTWGGEWQTPEMAQTLDELRSLGANSFAIHPYARIANDGQVTFRVRDENRHITVPLDWARERGMSALLVPHIAYWGSKFSWRGEIKFETAEEWDRFFTGYEAWIVQMARLAEAHRAAVFCVGLEYTHAQKFEQRWRQIIAAVRAVYSGKITYGANWNDYQTVKFWDAVDYLGVLAVFPAHGSQGSDRRTDRGRLAKARRRNAALLGGTRRQADRLRRNRLQRKHACRSRAVELRHRRGECGCDSAAVPRRGALVRRQASVARRHVSLEVVPGAAGR
jgi:hypothetical protein